MHLKLFSAVLFLALAFAEGDDVVNHLRGNKDVAKAESPVTEGHETSEKELQAPEDLAQKEDPQDVAQKEPQDVAQEATKEGTEGVALGEQGQIDEKDVTERLRNADGGCRRWASCRNGSWGNIRCTGGRYCTLWRYRDGQWGGIDCKNGRHCTLWR